MGSRLIFIVQRIPKSRIFHFQQHLEPKFSYKKATFSSNQTFIRHNHTFLPQIGATHLLHRNKFNSSESSCSSFADIQLTQRRNISQSFHSNYLSPEFPPIGLAQNFLETVHSSTGLPWWASIALATFALRTFITLPLVVYSSHNIAKVELLQPEIKALAEELTAEVKHAQMEKKWDSRIARYHFKWNMKRIVKDLYVRDNCHPFKEYILPWVQIPLWISISLALRNMAGALPVEGVAIPMLCPDLATGGALWFTNLLLPDSSFILPFVMCLSNLIIIEMQNLKVQNPKRFQKAVTYFFRGLTVVIFPIAASVPSCMCLYWTCSSLYGLGQNVLLKLPKVRRFFRIPTTPSESQRPFRDLATAAREKYSFRKKSLPPKNSQEKSQLP